MWVRVPFFPLEVKMSIVCVWKDDCREAIKIESREQIAATLAPWGLDDFMADYDLEDDCDWAIVDHMDDDVLFISDEEFQADYVTLEGNIMDYIYRPA
jgi:hypothetical protein